MPHRVARDQESQIQALTLAALLQISVATAMFIGAGSMAKAWSVGGSNYKYLAATLLYMAGNFIMMRLLRQVGMSTAFSLTNVLQVVVLNGIAIAVFGEKVSLLQGVGVALAVASLILISFAPPGAP